MTDYARIEKVIRHIAAHYREQPDLGELASVAGLSPHHFHRLFKAWAGTTPKDFVQHLTALEARRRLQAGGDVLGTALDVGLSGPGRLHDLCVSLEAASPGEIKSGGRGWTLVAGCGETPFGRALLAWTPRGICRLAFLDSDAGAAQAEAELRRDWPQAEWRRDDREAGRRLRAMFEPCRLPPPAGEGRQDAEEGRRWQVLVRGTKFQQRVWRALVEVPAGAVETYSGLARRIGAPRGARAVGSAVGDNPVAFLIPCHRVIQASGACGNYHWGTERKKAMLVRERISARLK